VDQLFYAESTRSLCLDPQVYSIVFVHRYAIVLAFCFDGSMMPS